MHVPVLDQIIAIETCRPLPIQIEHFLWWPDVFAGIAMAIEAEGHAQRLHLPNFIELMNFTMAMDAADTPIHMDGVIEINEVRRFMNLDPLNWRIVCRTLPNRFKPWVLVQHLIVAVYANARTGNI